jgi:hypothetical protein
MASASSRGPQSVAVDQHRNALPASGAAAHGARAHRFSGAGTTGTPVSTVADRRGGGRADGPVAVASRFLADAWSVAWVVAILVLVLAATLAVALGLPEAIRLAVTVPFALLAPGMAVARLRHLRSRFAELVLAVMLSLGILGLVAGALFSVDMWDPGRAVMALAVVTIVALELDPRIPARTLVWRESWIAARDRAPALSRSVRARVGIVAPVGNRSLARSPLAEAPVNPRALATPSAQPSTRLAEPLPAPPVAVVRRGPRRSPDNVQPAKPRARRQAFGEDPLENPAVSRHMRSAIDGVIDDLAARKDAPAP